VGKIKVDQASYASIGNHDVPWMRISVHDQSRKIPPTTRNPQRRSANGKDQFVPREGTRERRFWSRKRLEFCIQPWQLTEEAGSAGSTGKLEVANREMILRKETRRSTPGSKITMTTLTRDPREDRKKSAVLRHERRSIGRA
jgi:hypothetical protein